MRFQFVVRSTSIEDMLSSLEAVGIEVRTQDEDGNPLRPEAWVGRCFAPPFEDVRGDWISTICTKHDDQEMADNIRQFFLCDYDPDLTVLVDEEEVPMDWPIYDLPDVTDSETGETITGQTCAGPRMQI